MFPYLNVPRESELLSTVNMNKSRIFSLQEIKFPENIFSSQLKAGWVSVFVYLHSYGMTLLLLDVCSLFLIRAAGVTQIKIKRCDTKGNVFLWNCVSL